MKTLNLTAASLRAAILVAPKNDLRYYLNGVCLQFGDELYVIATNGNLLFASRQPLDHDCAQQKEIIIPYATVVAALRSHPRKLKHLSLEGLDDGRYILAGTTVFRPIDGAFPTWDRLVPEKTSGEAGQFNPKYIAIAGRALRAWIGLECFPFLHHNGPSGCAIMQAKDDAAFVLIMPMRVDPEGKTLGFKSTVATLKAEA